jgi:hypothetical protein
MGSTVVSTGLLALESTMRLTSRSSVERDVEYISRVALVTLRDPILRLVPPAGFTDHRV